MPRERDQIWEFVEEVGKAKVKCNFCRETFTKNSTRMKSHLAKIPCKDIQVCNAVPDTVVQIVRAYLEVDIKLMRTYVGSSYNPSIESKFEQVEVGAGQEADSVMLPPLSASIYGLVNDEELGNSDPDDVAWLYSLSESEVDLLICLKKLAIQRASVIDCENLVDKFDLRMLRALDLDGMGFCCWLWYVLLELSACTLAWILGGPSSGCWDGLLCMAHCDGCWCGSLWWLLLWFLEHVAAAVVHCGGCTILYGSSDDLNLLVDGSPWALWCGSGCLSGLQPLLVLVWLVPFSWFFGYCSGVFAQHLFL